jgi:chemotaxis-related protein WspD
MTRALPQVQPGEGDCWNHIGVWGNHTCPKLAEVTHCHNCPVFSAAGRRFLDAPSPAGYIDEWTARLATPETDAATDETSVLAFRLREEWLALSVSAMVEVTTPRPVHRIPHRGGLLAGLVNIRGELHLCAKLDQLLGLDAADPESDSKLTRLLVVRRDADAWVFAADEVDRVRRIAAAEVTSSPPTVARAAARLTRGVVRVADRSVGLIDETRLFLALRERIR